MPISNLRELKSGDLLLSVTLDDDGQLDVVETYSFVVLSESRVEERGYSVGDPYDVVDVLPLATHDPSDTEPRTFVRRVGSRDCALQLFRVPR